MNTNELVKKIKNIRSDLKKKLYFMAYLSSILSKQGKQIPTIIGGLALSYYSREIYSTADIDLSYNDMKSIDDILKEHRFRKEGRYWISEELDIVLEIPVSALIGEDAPLEKVEVEENLICNIIGLEDLIIDRMNACKHWRSRIDCEMVELLLIKYNDSINWEYLDMKSKLPQNDIYIELNNMKNKINERK